MRLFAVVAAGLAVLLLTGCGIQVETQPRALPTGESKPSASPEGTAPPTPLQQEVTLWFVRSGQLVPAMRSTTGPVTSQQLLDLLAAGPTAQEQAEGIRTAAVSVVSGQPLMITAQAAQVEVLGRPADEVTIVLKPEFKDLLPREQVLVLGEVVTTVAVDRVRKVLFVDEDGQVLGVPTADGRLANGPVGPEDYAALIG